MKHGMKSRTRVRFVSLIVLGSLVLLAPLSTAWASDLFMMNQRFSLPSLQRETVTATPQAGELLPTEELCPLFIGPHEAHGSWSKVLGSNRFQLVLNCKAVLDKETGLVWERSPDGGYRTWEAAKRYCSQKEIGGRKAWRAPGFHEIASLVDPSQAGPALPSGHPFKGIVTEDALDGEVIGVLYWSATTSAEYDTEAWAVRLQFGEVRTDPKTDRSPVWCVRGGHPGPKEY